ncbi:hypothetical protein [Microbacterium oleivorans]|uniref:Integral membrane protein n=1 Tax=Microbacterium oleivorans TaxID=273677 RepID=A0A7D5IRF7_9MICO|nr:hypothetical protein [Microbacterium oleivorans]QLD10557.1 hypothetical protein HW566_01420 [Microbacterium oleivorans]
MQILLALIFGAAIGLAAEMLVRGRESRGAVLAPVLGALVAAAGWAALTWAGLGVADPAIWVTAIAAPAIVTPVVLSVLTRARAARDERERQRLRIG